MDLGDIPLKCNQQRWWPHVPASVGSYRSLTSVGGNQQTRTAWSLWINLLPWCPQDVSTLPLFVWVESSSIFLTYYKDLPHLLQLSWIKLFLPVQLVWHNFSFGENYMNIWAGIQSWLAMELSFTQLSTVDTKLNDTVMHKFSSSNSLVSHHLSVVLKLKEIPWSWSLQFFQIWFPTHFFSLNSCV